MNIQEYNKCKTYKGYHGMIIRFQKEIKEKHRDFDGINQGI